VQLQPGTRLGPYEIVERVGAGGVGEVYRARDTRLSRSVAIKVLSTEFAADMTARTRFEQEAKTISALNHPHICTLHDVGRENGTDYLVMEFCEGKTLAERLERGPLPIAQVIEYGAQIAEALDKAHRDGIVHRDLKPSNVMITKSGVKLLDFGLARKHSGVMASRGSETTTFDKPNTENGRVVGTLQYMAPETLTSGEVDARSDIFSLGLVLYEMICGRPAFHDDSKAKLISAILEREPAPLANHASSADPHLVHIVARCLAKDPDQRWQSAADIAAELRWLQSKREIEDAPIGQRQRRTLLWLSVALFVIAVSTALMVVVLKRSPPLTGERRVTSLMIAEGPLVIGSFRPLFEISPDGRSIVYIAGDPPLLYLRRISEPDAKPLPGTENARSPFFSPDSRWIGFVSDDKLRRVSTAGGDPQTICEVPAFAGTAVWGANDEIVFGRAGALYRVSVAEGVPVPLTTSQSGERYGVTSFLPGEKKVLITISRSFIPSERTIAALELSTGKVSPILTNGAQPYYYSPTGHLLFLRCGPANLRSATIFSVEFDPKTNRIRGAPTPRVMGLQAAPLTGTAYWTLAADGAIVYLPFNPDFVQRELIWLDRQGHSTLATSRTANFRDLAVSPDGGRVAFDDLANIWVGDLARDTWFPLPVDAQFMQCPVWSPDGRQIVFQASARDGRSGLYASPADGSGQPILLLKSDRLPAPSSWSSDGKTVAYDVENPQAFTDRDIWTLDVTTGKATPLIATPKSEEAPSFSPDGHWIAYASRRPSDSEIHVAPFPGPGPRHTIVTGAPCPKTLICVNSTEWSADGRELFFQSGDKVMVVDVDTRNREFRAGTPRVLFQSDFESFDVYPDGKRFIAPHWKRQPRWDHLNLVTGWWNN
jgi:eukaryotic-like serine/threonine-protein kinase